MLQYKLLEIAPGALRWYRTRLTLDWPRLTSLLPRAGSLLEVGCGTGVVTYELARARPGLRVTGIDVDAASVARARLHHSLPNVTFAAVELGAVRGSFDCILFSDVFHHVPPAEHDGLLRHAAARLNPGGYVLIKDVERRRGAVSDLLDRYVSGCARTYLMNCDELRAKVERHLEVVWARVRFKPPFPHYYICARRPS